MCEAVGASAENKALLSYKSRRPTVDAAGEIVREIALKETLSALSALVDEMIESFSEEENYLLEYKYFRRKSVLGGRFADFSLGCTERSYFRKQNRLLLKAADIFSKRGWTEEKFLDETDGLFSRVMSALGSGQEQAVRERRKRGRPHSSDVSSS